VVTVCLAVLDPPFRVRLCPPRGCRLGCAHSIRGAAVSQVEDSPRGAASASELNADERGELERLRQEVAALRTAPAPRRARIRWASLAAAVLLFLGCLGVPASVLAVWTHNQVADSDRFVATVSPMIEDPSVQSALAGRITTEVLAVIDVEQLARGVLVGAVPEQGAAAAAASYDLLVRFLREALRTLAVLGLVIALGAYLAAPAAAAVQIRTALTRAINGMRRGRVRNTLRTGPVGPWVHAHVGLQRGAAVGLAVLGFVLLDRPTGLDVLLLALGLALVLAVIEFLDQAPEPPQPTETAPAGTPA
jgi:hypothetical protein